MMYGDYDVIHAHDWLTFRAALAAKQVSGKPLFVHIHSTEYDRAGGKHGNPMVEEIEYVGLHLADRIFAISQATKNTIIRHYGIPADKIEVVHNAMEFESHELNEDTVITSYSIHYTKLYDVANRICGEYTVVVIRVCG